MNKFWVVVATNSPDGYTYAARHPSYASAMVEARSKAQRFPDTTYFICESQTAVLCPPSEVLVYEMRGAVRETA